jgi:hypothetical protein
LPDSRDLLFLAAKKPFPDTSLHQDCPRSAPSRPARRSGGLDPGLGMQGYSHIGG